MKQSKRSAERQKSDLGSIVCERINKVAALGDLVVPIEMTDSKLEQDCEKRIKLISAKLVEGNVRAGIRLAVAPFDKNTYGKLQSKHSRVPNHAQQVVEESLFTFELIVAKAINSFPSGPSVGPSLLLLVPQLYKDLIAKSNGVHSQRVTPKANNPTKKCLSVQNPCKTETLFFFDAKLTAEFDQLLLEIPCVEYAQNVWAPWRLTNDELIFMVRSSTD